MSWSRRTFGGALAGAAVCLLAARRPPAVRAESGVHRVTITGFRFEPAVLTIRPGDRVEWINRDIVPHTATARDGRWDTGNLVKDETGLIDFAAPGRTEYFCAFHPNMAGTIIVEV